MKTPKTFLVGMTQMRVDGMSAYLEHTQQTDFMFSLRDSVLHGGLQLCSFFAKLCYRSLVLGKNSNITSVRDIQANLESIVEAGHGSVLEHCWFNFVTTDCSRVFTHELVRHRVGTAFSQTSGRYCTVEDAELVLPDELDEEVKLQMQAALDSLKKLVGDSRVLMKLDEEKDFARKKRIMPNGATNEIGWSCNLRSLRHMLEMRTSRHAEWEIRVVFNEVAEIMKEQFPFVLYGSEAEVVDGLTEYRKLRI